ncbi:MAG: hypothetical protein ACK4QW_02715 [Alphaproteobacteria bacterium]
MDRTAPDMGTFALYILVPLLAGAAVGALSHPEARLYGVFVGGISGAVAGLIAMIAFGHLRE